MPTADFTTTVAVDQPPEVVLNVINRVREWWSAEIEGSTEKLNDAFSYHYKDVHISKVQKDVTII